jgi:hypothetical protein
MLIRRRFQEDYNDFCSDRKKPLYRAAFLAASASFRLQASSCKLFNPVIFTGFDHVSGSALCAFAVAFLPLSRKGKCKVSPSLRCSGMYSGKNLNFAG